MKEINLLADELRPLLPSGLGGYTFDTQGQSGIEARLSLRNYRTLVAPRIRGGETPVVPLIKKDFDRETYWLSLYLLWTESADSRSVRLIYHTAGVTIFQGRHADTEKLQILRSEWPGLRFRPEDGTFVFESPGAGHPHWQVDALQHRLTLRKRDEEEREQIFRELRGEVTVGSLSDLLATVQTPAESFVDDERHVAWSKMHLAQRAIWDEQPWTANMNGEFPHASSPKEFFQVRNWLISSVSYVRQEIQRFTG